jgi:hypothetical protein
LEIQNRVVSLIPSRCRRLQQLGFGQAAWAGVLVGPVRATAPPITAKANATAIRMVFIGCSKFSGFRGVFTPLT